MVLLLGLAAAWAAWGCGIGRGDVSNPDGWPVAERFLAAALSPELSGSFLSLLGAATAITVAYAALGAAAALLLGAVGALLVGATSWRRASGDMAPSAAAVWTAARGVSALPRGLHEAVWGILLVNVLGLDPLVAILAIAIPYGAVTAKVWADLLDETPHAAYDRLRLGGAGRLSALLVGLVPQARGDLLSYAFYRFECALRSAVLLGIVGAGGLGFQLDVSFAALRYGEMWTVLFVVVVLCAGVDRGGAALRRRLAGPPRPGRDPVVVAVAGGLLGLLVWSWLYLAVDLGGLVGDQVREQIRLIAGSAWPVPLDGPVLAALGRAGLETVQMSLLAIALAGLGGVLLAPLAARRTTAGLARRVLGGTTRLGLLLLRAIPSPVWALVLLFVTLPGPLPGALALALYNLGVLGRLCAEAVENVDPAPTDALLVGGASPAVAWLYGTFPRLGPRLLVFVLYRWEVVVRETVVVGIVGAGGLGDLLAGQIAAFDWGAVAATLTALVLLTFAVDLASAGLRRALR